MNDEANMPENEDLLPEDAPAEAPAADDRDAEIADLRDRLLRTAAETENVRRRLERDKQDAVAYAITGFARDLLGVVDNLRRALDAIPADARENEAVKTVVTGVEMTERELSNVLQRHGIKRIEAKGQKLDPNLHQAMIEVEDGEAEPGTVVQELQAGYVIKDRLLRPALVSVSKKRASDAA
jgi:molecular chaperone GrpE